EYAFAYQHHRGLFQPTAYWTNTQDDDPEYSGWAWCQDFYGGGQTSSGECSKLRARAVRRLTI
ncbi:MAG: hypothetical protein KGL35_29550, partial [Bradyrhizobium sp.]|nr:hypothetical protein [Bradyrhizobium sp.]